MGEARVVVRSRYLYFVEIVRVEIVAWKNEVLGKEDNGGGQL